MESSSFTIGSTTESLDLENSLVHLLILKLVLLGPVGGRPEAEGTVESKGLDSETFSETLSVLDGAEDDLDSAMALAIAEAFSTTKMVERRRDTLPLPL